MVTHRYLTTLLLLSGAASSVFALDHEEKKEKRSAAEGSNPLSSLGGDWKTPVKGFTSGFDKYGVSNAIPGLGPAAESTANAEKSKRSAAEGNNPLSSLGGDWKTPVKGFTSGFDKYGVSNAIPGFGPAAESTANAEKSKRSAAEGNNPLSSLGSDWKTPVKGFTSGFDKYGVSNAIPGFGPAAESTANAEKSKRSAAEGNNPLSSLGGDWKTPVKGFTSGFDKYGVSNAIPGFGPAAESTANAEKSKRSAAEGSNPLSSLGGDWKTPVKGFTSGFDKYGVSNAIPGFGPAAESTANAEKSKRSAAEGSNPLSSLGGDWKTPVKGFTSGFDKYGVSNAIPGFGPAAESTANAEKSKRSAAEGNNPLSSLGSDWKTPVKGFTSGFDKYGVSNAIPGFGPAAESTANAEKSKRSAAEGNNPLSSLGGDWKTPVKGFTSGFDKYGVSHAIPGFGPAAESTANAEKSKRSAAEGSNPLSSLGGDWKTPVKGFTSGFDKYGVSNAIPGFGPAAESTANAEKSKRSAAEGNNPLSSLGSDWKTPVKGFTSGFDKYGVSNAIPGFGPAAESTANAEKSKRSAAEGNNPLSSLGSDWKTPVKGFTSGFDKYGVSNAIPGFGPAAESTANAEKSKRSAAEGNNPLSSLGSDWKTPVKGFTSGFDKYGVSNAIPGFGPAAESTANAEKSKRSAAEGNNPLSSLGGDWKTPVKGFTSGFDKYGVSNAIPGFGPAAESTANAEKSKRSSSESSPSWTEKLKSFFTGDEAKNRE